MSATVNKRGRRFDRVDYGGRQGWILDVIGPTPLYHVLFSGGDRRTIAAGPGVKIIKVSVAELAAAFGEPSPVVPRQLRIARRARRRMLRRELRRMRSR